MSTTSRRLSKRGVANRNNHTPGKDKGGYCVRKPSAMFAVNTNPYKGQGLAGERANKYDQWWTYAQNAKGNK